MNKYDEEETACAKECIHEENHTDTFVDESENENVEDNSSVIEEPTSPAPRKDEIFMNKYEEGEKACAKECIHEEKHFDAFGAQCRYKIVEDHNNVFEATTSMEPIGDKMFFDGRENVCSEECIHMEKHAYTFVDQCETGNVEGNSVIEAPTSPETRGDELLIDKYDEGEKVCAKECIHKENHSSKFRVQYKNGNVEHNSNANEAPTLPGTREPDDIFIEKYYDVGDLCAKDCIHEEKQSDTFMVQHMNGNAEDDVLKAQTSPALRGEEDMFIDENDDGDEVCTKELNHKEKHSEWVADQCTKGNEEEIIMNANEAPTLPGTREPEDMFIEKYYDKGDLGTKDCIHEEKQSDTFMLQYMNGNEEDNMLKAPTSSALREEEMFIGKIDDGDEVYTKRRNDEEKHSELVADHYTKGNEEIVMNANEAPTSPGTREPEDMFIEKYYDAGDLCAEDCIHEEKQSDTFMVQYMNENEEDNMLKASTLPALREEEMFIDKNDEDEVYTKKHNYEEKHSELVADQCTKGNEEEIIKAPTWFRPRKDEKMSIDEYDEDEEVYTKKLIYEKHFDTFGI